MVSMLYDARHRLEKHEAKFIESMLLECEYTNEECMLISRMYERTFPTPPPGKRFDMAVIFHGV